MNVHKRQAMEENAGTFLQIDALIKNHLSETARRGRFPAICGFVVCGLFFLRGTVSGFFFNRFSPETAYEVSGSYATGYTTGMMLALALLVGVLYFFPCLFLFRLSAKMKKALAANDQVGLAGAFQNLKSLFKFVGTLTLIVPGSYAIAIVAAIVIRMAGRY